MTDWRRPQCQALEANLLAYWLIGVTEEIKSPCNRRGFGWLGSVRKSHQSHNSYH